jgi:hypothetical protein
LAGNLQVPPDYRPTEKVSPACFRIVETIRGGLANADRLLAQANLGKMLVKVN